MDAITLLRADHKAVEQLFKQFEQAGDRAFVEKRRLVDRIIEALSVHAAIEEQVFYPVARQTVPATEDIALESLEEHHIVKWLLSELVGLDPQAERFDAKVSVLMENVRHHVEEEQNDFFPKVRAGLSRSALDDLGAALEGAKKTAPTRPHPRMSDQPPANAVVGAITGVVDRIGDNVSGIAQGGVSALQDLIARILGSAKPKTSPTVQKTAKSAASGAKATATTAKKSAQATKTAAKRAATTTGRTAKAEVKKTPARTKQAASTKRPGTAAA